MRTGPWVWVCSSLSRIAFKHMHTDDLHTKPYSPAIRQIPTIAINVFSELNLNLKKLTYKISYYLLFSRHNNWLLNVKQLSEVVLFLFFFIFCLSLNIQTENQIIGCRKPYIVPNFAWKGLSVLIEKGVLYSQLFVECLYMYNCTHNITFHYNILVL